MAAPVQEKRFLIPVERQWKLWLWPLVAILYFAWVLFLALGGYETRGIPMDLWILGGLGLFGFVLLVELLLLVRRKARRAKVSRKERRKARKAEAAAAAAAPAEAEPEASAFARPGGGAMAIEAPEPEPASVGPTEAPSSARPRGPDVEVRIPGEKVKGRRVLELSLPPKSRNEGALYAKAYVPVGDDLVVRVETLTADPSDFA